MTIDATTIYQNCQLCHRHCGADRVTRNARNEVRTGYCGMPDTLFLARAALHYWEEPCISGETGSGTVFFSGCSLRCVYCQNHSIALGLSGKGIDIGRLTEIFLELAAKGAANINLVTPTHYVPSILPAIDAARAQGLKLPIVYNTGSFETLDTLKMLEGYVDIYLPDFKYWHPEIARRYSAAPDYAVHARENIAEMFRQVGMPVFAAPEKAGTVTEAAFAPSGADKTDSPDTLLESEVALMQRGIIVRHLTLPDALEDSKQIIRYLYEAYENNIFLSILNQYTPLSQHLSAYPELNRRITEAEYEELIDYAIELGVENAFIQEGEAAEESFIPSFTLEGV